MLAFGSAAYAMFSAFLPDHSRQLGLSGSGELFAVYSVVCLGVRLVGARLPERLGPRTSVTTTFACSAWPGAARRRRRSSGRCGWRRRSSAWRSAFLYPSLMALTVNRAPRAERARAISSFTMFFEIGTATGALVLGAVADALGKRSGFGVAVVLCVPGCG